MGYDMGLFGRMDIIIQQNCDLFAFSQDQCVSFGIGRSYRVRLDVLVL
jgi:hypothetical protein